jgi:hypothetical protein
MKNFSLLTSSFLLATAFCNFALAEEGDLLVEDDLLSDDLLSEDSPFLEDTNTSDEKSWKDYFVFTLAHEQTRDDTGDTLILRYNARVEYEQAFASNWYARIDAKGNSYRSPDRLAKQRVSEPATTDTLLETESYQKGKLNAAWLQYSKNACVIKAGQQTLIWGEVNGTFTVDDITPFDFTEQLLTDYSSVRLALPMAVGDCFLKHKQQVQAFYIPKAQLHQSSHTNDEYSLKLATGVDDKDLDSEWGARYKFSLGKTEFALMYAELIANAPSQILVTVSPDPLVPPSVIPVLSEYELFGFSFNYSSGAWQFKGDIAYKSDQLIDQTFGETTNIVDMAAGFEYLSPTNHSFNMGLWGAYAEDVDTVEQDLNNNTPALTLGWNKSYLSDDLDLSLLASGREKPKSASATAQASYQYNDYWNFSSALTLVERVKDKQNPNPLQSENNEVSLQVKYQF